MKLTSKFENAVPGGLLFGPRGFRLGLPMSNWRLADCAAFRVARFPFAFGLELAFCTPLRKGMGEGVNPNWSDVDEDVDEAEDELGAVMNEDVWVWK